MILVRLFAFLAAMAFAPQASAHDTSDASASTVDAAAAPQAPAPAVPAPFTAGWRDGFVLQSTDGAFRLQLGLLVHTDGRFALGDTGNAIVNTFAIRRLRPTLQGRLFNRVDVSLNPDLAGGTLVVQDAFLDTRFSTAFRVRVGKTKTPFGLERLHSASGLLFFERALPTALVPNRDIGVQALGDLAGGTISYAAGVLNGVTDGASADLDTTDSKDLAGRLLLRPAARQAGSALSGLGIGFAATRGRQTTLPTFRTASLQQPFLAYTGATGDGVRVRYSPQLFYYAGPFGAFAEFVHSSQPIRRGDVAAGVAHRAWQVAVSWTVTGERATDRGVRPAANFGSGSRGAGAVQVAARYHRLSVDPHALTLGLTTPGASRTADAFTAGLNWYLNPHFKYVVNFERTVFDGDAGGIRPAENAVVFRTQLGF